MTSRDETIQRFKNLIHYHIHLKGGDTMIKTTVYNKPIGYCTPVKNHNIGRRQAKAIRKEFVV